MSDIICVTNREDCAGDFLSRLSRIAAARPLCLLLREPDYPLMGYPVLAGRVRALCRPHSVPVVLHGRGGLLTETAQLHLPLFMLRKLSPEHRAGYKVLGTSVHSIEEAQEAIALGASYLVAGNIFPTRCKPGLPGRGLSFLNKVCTLTEMPVYAIGGVTPENIAGVREAGAAGACVMSGFMHCEDPEAFLEAFEP